MNVAGNLKNYHENKLEKTARLVISIFMILIMGFLTIVSLLHTTGMDIVPEIESVSYLNDNFYLNILLLALSAAVCLIIMPLLKKMPLWVEIAVICIWTIILGLIWVYSSQSAPTEDSFHVTNASLLFADNDFSPLNEDYFKNYSFQLGYVFFNEILIRIASIFTEVQNLLFLEALNVIFLAAVYAGILLINNKIFDDKRICHLTFFLLLFSFQPILFSSFLYGIIPGLMFAVWAVYFEISYLKESKIYQAILSAVFIALAVMIKSNYNIILIAILAMAFVKLFSRKKYIKDIVYMVLCVVLAVSITPAVKSMYESKSGIDLGDSIPYVSWISMGMNEPSFAGCAPGWYNYSCTVTNFEENNFNSSEASKDSIENIKERLSYFISDPQYANDFFYEKIVSQWNETSYQSIWTNKVRGQYAEKGALASWVCNEGESAVSTFMDLYTQLIFAAVLFGVIMCTRNKNLFSTIFPLIILGGFLYHLISEAKSQYSIPYYVIMTGFAAYGLCCLYDILAAKAGKNKWISKLFNFPKHEMSSKIEASDK